jgi:hypothetical protein
MGSNPQYHPRSDRGLQFTRVKAKSLVIVNQHVTVKKNQTLHTPPITPVEGLIAMVEHPNGSLALVDRLRHRRS